MKFMTWTLHAPSTSTFSQYKDLPVGEPWYSKNYVTVNQDAIKNWDHRQRGFVEMIERHHNKIYSIGLHEFVTDPSGIIYNYGYSNWKNYPVLNSEKTDIQYPVPTSLRYLMHKYPNIKWTIQLFSSTEKNVEPILDNVNNCQDVMLDELKKVAQIYISKGFPIGGIEMDFEKTTTRSNEDVLYRDLLVRVKNEVCIPLGLELRVNMYAMTGEHNPSYYGWHNYSTLASGIDINGNQAIDEFQLMTYDFSWGGSAPGPSTPLWWLEQVLEHVANVLPPEKTFIGNAGYGRRWPLSDQRYGVTFDYKQLMTAQNGTYIHNPGQSNPDGTFPFNDQDFIPFAGFNDPASDYQITYLHVYDFFKAAHGTMEEIEFPGEYVTNYSTKQRPIFTGLQAIAKTPTISGNVSQTYQTTTDLGTFQFYVAQKARWFWNEGLRDENGNIIPGTGSCELEQGDKGIDGSLTYNFNLPSAGYYKVIALVGFPFFGNDNFDITINGINHKIGNAIPDWYPYYTNPSWHYWDCGTYSLGTSNTINVGVTNGAWIGGFIICSGYDKNKTGGKIHFPANLQRMKKRGPKKADGNSEIIDAQFPTNMVVTGEMLRRPPRPAIIWEDMFGPHLSGDDFTTDSDLTMFSYYLKANSSSYSIGSGPNPHIVGGKTYCIDQTRAVGFSYGKWTVSDDGTDAAHARADLTSNYGQLVLNKQFTTNIHVELDCRINETNTQGAYGVRVIAEKGNPSTGWIARLNYGTGKVEWIDLQNSANNRYADMSTSLKNGLGERYTITVQIINKNVRISVGSRLYLDFQADYLPQTTTGLAYGAYGTRCYIKVYRLNVSTLDRWEPMEKIRLIVDNQNFDYGEVARDREYDEYGYIIYTGLPGDLTTAVRAIPPEDSGIDHRTVPGRAGTIYETEIEPEYWNLDYQNIPIAKISSWIGKKDVTIEMRDPGIWLRSLYVGDAEGYSVAYNSDKIGFIRTSQLVLNYKCKGIALWTLGQEDPQIFDYIPEPEK